MTRILITGGNGHLGQVLVSKLSNYPAYTIRVMSRSPRPENLKPVIEWVQADLEMDKGLDRAVDGAQTIIHAATSPQKHSRQVDVDGTRRLLEHARRAGLSHLVYISIVGVDRIPYSYYQNKLAAEQMIEDGGIPWSIQRTTQFHYLLDLFLQALTRFPIALVPTDLLFQPVGIEEVADKLIRCVVSGPSGRLPDMGGPEVLDGFTILQTWLQARRLQRKIVHIRLPGKVFEGFRNGYHTTPQNREGKLTWREWLERKYGQFSVSE